MPKLGLLGYPLGHSFSKGYFEQKFNTLNRVDYAYHLFPYEKVEDFYQNELSNQQNLPLEQQLLGFNVTIPHKQSIIPYLDGLDATAYHVGAVNTVKYTNRQWIGYNTDVVGFEKSLLKTIPQTPNIAKNIYTAYILGRGGAAKAVAYTLQKYDWAYRNVVRGNSEEWCNTMTFDEFSTVLAHRTPHDKFLIINTTPLGTYPNIHEKPNILYEKLQKGDVLMDLVYNPPLTAFLENGLQQGCTIENGLTMLHEQAEAAWLIWTNP